MNIFIKVVNGKFISGYNPTLLAQDYPELPFDFLREDNPLLNQYNIYICNRLERPPFVQNEFNCALKDPELIDGLWIQDWQIIEKSPEEKRNIVPIVAMNQAKKSIASHRQIRGDESGDHRCGRRSCD